MAGLPPMLGFIGKELLYEAKLQAPAASGWITAAGVAANALTVAIAGIVALRPFWGAQRPTPRTAHEPPLALLLGPVVLAGIGLAVGLVPGTLEALIAAAAGAIRGEPTTVSLALWHGAEPRAPAERRHRRRRRGTLRRRRARSLRACRGRAGAAGAAVADACVPVGAGAAAGGRERPDAPRCRAARSAPIC